MALLCVGMSSVCVLLSHWQWSRADWKAQQMQQAAERRKAPAMKLDSPQALAGLGRWQPAAFSAAPLQAPLVYLDNQIRDGRSGYKVYQAILLQDTGHAALWSRAWLPTGPDRAVLPQAELEGALPEEAMLLPAPAAGLDLGAAAERLDGALRVQQVDFSALSELLGIELIPYILSGSEDAVAGPRYHVSPERHRAYAFQWLALGLLLPLLLAFYGFRKFRARA